MELKTRILEWNKGRAYFDNVCQLSSFSVGFFHASGPIHERSRKALLQTQTEQREGHTVTVNTSRFLQ